MAAVKQNSVFDNASLVVTLLGISMPVFWLGLLLIITFSLKLDLFPTGGADTWKSYIMPAFCLAFSNMSTMARTTRSSMLETIRQDYVRTAAAKGVPRKAVLRSNAKADFCRYMNALLAQYGVARPGDTQDSIAYKLATAYFQASCYGDCWYLTRYYHSVGDTVLACEKDFAAEAVRYLEVCGRSQNIDMRRTALYALAYIPTDP